jgi:hypothetical protein
MRLTIVGTRTFLNIKLFEEKLRELVGEGQEIEIVVTGDSAGPDAFAVEWTKHLDIPYYIKETQWTKYGDAAGPIRNTLVVGAVDKTIAFWDGKSTGTLDTIKKTRRAGKSVHIVRVDEEHVDLFDLVSDT